MYVKVHDPATTVEVNNNVLSEWVRIGNNKKMTIQFKFQFEDIECNITLYSCDRQFQFLTSSVGCDVMLEEI